MTVKLTLEFATMAELTSFIAKSEGNRAGDAPEKSTKSTKSTASSPAAAPEAPAPTPATAPSESSKPKAREYKDTKIAKMINDAVDAGKGPAVKKILVDLKAFDPTDNTKVKGPFIKPEDFDKAEEMFAALAKQEDLG